LEKWSWVSKENLRATRGPQFCHVWSISLLLEPLLICNQQTIKSTLCRLVVQYRFWPLIVGYDRPIEKHGPTSITQILKFADQCCRVCHRLRLIKKDDYFLVNFNHFWIECPFLRHPWQKWKLAGARDFQNRNFAVVISYSLFKTGKSGTEWYCVIPGTFSVPCRSLRPNHHDQIKHVQIRETLWYTTLPVSRNRFKTGLLFLQIGVSEFANWSKSLACV